jgi:hypothetical protein
VLAALLVAGCEGGVPQTDRLDRVFAPTEPGIDVALTPFIGRLVTVDAIAGVGTARLILDTGGGDTVISPDMAERLGCTPSGRSVGFRMSGERVEFELCPAVTLEIGGVPFEHEQIAVWDIGAVLPEDVPAVDGVLSLKTFARQPITLRLAERLLTLESHASLAAQTAEMSLVRSRIATGADGDVLTVLVRGTAPARAWYLLDSGNLDLVQAAPHVAEAARPGAETWEDTLVLDGLQGEPASFRAHDIIYDGVLSEEFMRRWVWSFDLERGRVWAAPAAKAQ